jgi:hypothetical protein
MLVYYCPSKSFSKLHLASQGDLSDDKLDYRKINRSKKQF